MSELFYKAAGAIVAPFRYAEREAKSLKENIKEDLQAFVASLLKMVVIAIAGILFLLFLSISVANAINNSMDSEVAGYAFVAGFYLLVALILYILKSSEDKKKNESDHRKSIQA